MNKRRRMGQHFLASRAVASRMVESASISKRHTVLEVGTGRGALTRALCERAGRVVSVEADRGIYEEARARLAADNLELVCGDGFGYAGPFDVFVSSLPYSQSRRAVEWLCQRPMSRAVIMVQKEFYEKLARASRAAAVLAAHCFDTRAVCRAARADFAPPPAVESVVLRMEQKRTLDAPTVRAVNRMFSYRRKKLSNVLAEFGASSDSDRRLEQMGADEIVGIAKGIA